MTDRRVGASDPIPAEPDSGLHERPTVVPSLKRRALTTETQGSDWKRDPPSEPATRNRPTLKVREPQTTYAFLNPDGGSAEPTTGVRPIDDPIAEMRECFLLEDYERAVAMADLILGMQPDNVVARECQANCRAAQFLRSEATA